MKNEGFGDGVELVSPHYGVILLRSLGLQDLLLLLRRSGDLTTKGCCWSAPETGNKALPMYCLLLLLHFVVFSLVLG